MARSLCRTVCANEGGVRLDVYLANTGCYPSRSSAAKAIEAGKVFVNGDMAAKRREVNEGDTVVYEEASDEGAVSLIGEDIPLDVRYEDDHIIVLSKQTGLCVHPSPGHDGFTLCNALIYRYGRENLAHIQGDDRPGIVHRLDMETSGLLICAKTDEAGNAMQDMIRLRDVDRRYLALVHGNIAHDTGMIDQPISRGFVNRVRMVVSDRGNAREAITTFKVLERFDAEGKDNGFTLLECKLYTGRTHQIRVHMEYIGHPCVGDPLYSWGTPEMQLGLERRQFLHSYALGFDHPITGEHLAFLDALPPDLADALSRIGVRSSGATEEGERILRSLKDAPSQGEDVQL